MFANLAFSLPLSEVLLYLNCRVNLLVVALVVSSTLLYIECRLPSAECCRC
jgi:hypothetical protein